MPELPSEITGLGCRCGPTSYVSSSVDLPAPAIRVELCSAAISLSQFQQAGSLIDPDLTRCPTYCTTLGSEFAQLQSRLVVPLTHHKLQLLSISFDPE